MPSADETRSNLLIRVLAQWGDLWNRIFELVGGVSYLIYDVLVWLVRAVFSRKIRFGRTALVSQIVRIGVRSSAILFGQGDGGVGTGAFAVASLPALNNGGGLARGDFNADGITDLALTQTLANGTVGILIGQGAAGTGHGTFAAPVTAIG